MYLHIHWWCKVRHFLSWTADQKNLKGNGLNLPLYKNIITFLYLPEVRPSSPQQEVWWGTLSILQEYFCFLYKKKKHLIFSFLPPIWDGHNDFKPWQLSGVQENHLLRQAEQKNTQSLVLAGTTVQLNHAVWVKMNPSLFKTLLVMFSSTCKWNVPIR